VKLVEVISSVWCLFTFVPRVGSRGRVYQGRAACVQVLFRGSARRRHLLVTTDRKGAWQARSFADVALPGDFDLKDRDATRRLELLLLALDLSDL
jgi:hypothetical protein